MNETPTHYETLNVSRNAPLEVIRAAYKAMSLKYHPDRNTKDPSASEKMKQINIAHDILSDPGKRADYNFMLHQQEASANQTNASSPKEGRTSSSRNKADTPFDQSVADEICRRMAAGRELRDICKDEGMPSFQTVMDWRSANPLFANQLVHAHEQMFEKMAADGKGDPRHKVNDTAQRVGESGSTSDPSEAGIILFFVSFCYTLMLLFGFNRYLNFLPSSQWEKASAVISLGLGAVFATSTAPVVDWINTFITSLNNKEETEYDSRTNPVISALINSVFFYFLFVYGLGPVLTVFSSTIEKDIVGTRDHYFNHCYSKCGLDNYYIITADLPEHAFASFYITGDEFRSIPSNLDKAPVHVTLKQSFFGMTVEHYILPKK